jgi:hypothetical protein
MIAGLVKAALIPYGGIAPGGRRASLLVCRYLSLVSRRSCGPRWLCRPASLEIRSRPQRNHANRCSRSTCGYVL